MSHPMGDPIGGVAGKATPKVLSHGTPRASISQGVSSSAKALAGVMGRAGAKGQAQVSHQSGA
jgi:hypothetical protein